MAKPAWINLSKTSGSGSDSVSVSVSSFDGNTNRSGIITGSATSGGVSDTINITQGARSNYSVISTVKVGSVISGSITNITISSAGDTVTVIGQANWNSFNFTPFSADFSWSGNATVKIGSQFLSPDGSLSSTTTTIPFTGGG